MACDGRSAPVTSGFITGVAANYLMVILDNTSLWPRWTPGSNWATLHLAPGERSCLTVPTPGYSSRKTTEIPASAQRVFKRPVDGRAALERDAVRAIESERLRRRVENGVVVERDAPHVGAPIFRIADASSEVAADDDPYILYRSYREYRAETEIPRRE